MWIFSLHHNNPGTVTNYDARLRLCALHYATTCLSMNASTQLLNFSIIRKTIKIFRLQKPDFMQTHKKSIHDCHFLQLLPHLDSQHRIQYVIIAIVAVPVCFFFSNAYNVHPDNKQPSERSKR